MIKEGRKRASFDSHLGLTVSHTEDHYDNHYYFQFAAVSFMVILMLWGMAKLIYYASSMDYVWIILMTMLSYFVADFISGFVHWLADRYGTEQTFLVGPNFVKPFREHHVDKMKITRHNFIKANGNNSIVTIPFLICCHAFISFGSDPTFGIIVFSFGLFLSIWVFATNQFHKWAHQETVPKYVAYLQSTGLILSKAEHDKHHIYPHETNYCITSGVLNGLFEKIQFWYYLELLIFKTLRQKPFHDSSLPFESGGQSNS